MSYSRGDIRSWKGRDDRPGAGFGDNHRNAKLTEDQVREIKRIQALPKNQQPGRQELAARFGVSRHTLDNIRHGQTWSHVKLEEDA